MLGLAPGALWALWHRIGAVDRQDRWQQGQRPGRQRQVGGGRQQAAQRLCRWLVTLLYLRQHWTLPAMAQTLAGAESTVWNYSHERLPHLRVPVPASRLEQWQQACPRLARAELAQWLAALPEGGLRVDPWAQPLPRPGDDNVQAASYSGNQKAHTRKHQAIAHRRSGFVVKRWLMGWGMAIAAPIRSCQ